ncbi:MAG: hypothetical protein ACXVPQ_07405 [Bacteroidia bacterium]
MLCTVFQSYSFTEEETSTHLADFQKKAREDSGSDDDAPDNDPDNDSDVATAFQYSWYGPENTATIYSSHLISYTSLIRSITTPPPRS